MHSPAYLALLERVHQTHDLGKAAAVLSWDREVNMPPAGDPARVQQITTLRKLIHQGSTSAEMGEAIETAAADLTGADPASDQAGLIRVLRRDFEKSRKIPEALVVEMSQVGAKAWTVWKQARAEDDFARFRPHLERLIELQREWASLLGHTGEAYDALLDLYEEGSTTAEVRTLFDEVKAVSVPLVAEIHERGRPVDDRILHQPYAVDGQKVFARYIAESVGYDFARGHLATATHPFATSFSRDDARITTRWYPGFISPSLFGTLHECGHAMYEQGTAVSLARTPLARGTSSGIHESQSRMIENIVGRSLGFWHAHFGALQAQFPSQLGDATAEDFYIAINKVQPSLIRVEADELTYNLHIILRFELEQAMLSGDLAAADLPEAWNDKLESLLGIRPPNDREGVLQDVHWSGPSFGYFPTYALGNLYAAQLFATARKADAAVEQGIESGDCKALLAWLGENIHQHGRKFAPRELVQRATGRPLESGDFAAYVTEKFRALYAL